MSKKLTEAFVNGLVEEAITSDQDNGKKVKKALVATLQFMAGEAGRYQPLNRLFQGVTKSTSDGIRAYIRNMNDKYSVTITNADGKEVKIPFIRFSAADKQFVHNNKMTDEQQLEASKAARKAIAEMSDGDLMKIEFGTVADRNTSAAREFDAQKSLSDFIKRAAQNGESSAWLEQVNKLLEPGYRVDVMTMVANAKKAAASAIDRAQKAQARLNKFDQKPAPDVPALQEVKEETKAAA